MDAAYLVAKLPSLKVVIGDPNDDRLVACALRAKASYIVTRLDFLFSFLYYFDNNAFRYFHH